MVAMLTIRPSDNRDAIRNEVVIKHQSRVSVTGVDAALVVQT